MQRFTVSQQQQAYTSFPLKPQLNNGYIHQEHPKQVVIEEAEINIFDAERYFSEGQDQKQTKKDDKCDVPSIPRYSSVSSVEGYGRNYRTGSFNATPTASSEASWNSQSGLLKNPPGSIAVSMRNLRMDGRKKKSSSKWFFRRRCPCSGKKSIQVKEKYGEPKIVIRSHISKTEEEKAVDKASNEQSKELENKSMRRIEDERMKPEKLVTKIDCIKEQEVPRGDSEEQFSAEKRYSAEIGHRVAPSGRPFGDGGGFSFPILNPPPPTSIGKLLPGIGARVSINNSLDDPPRESLEVFQPLDESVVPGKSMERRGGVMSLREEINQRSFNFLTSPNIRKNEGEDDGDIMSDASSDLFEIESFSTQSAMYPMYRRRDSLDDMSSYGGSRFGRRSLDETTTMATPSIAPTECYEPSEASIDWSVTTAEGFSVANFSVSASEFQDGPTDHSRKILAAHASKRRGNGGLLMNCICEKAVNVTPPAIKSMSEQQHHHNHQHRSCAGPPPFPVESNRIQAASRLSSINIPITRSHSARMSRALATH